MSVCLGRLYYACPEQNGLAARGSVLILAVKRDVGKFNVVRN